VSSWPKNFGAYAKFIIAAVGGAGVIASAGLLHGSAQTWLVTGIAVVDTMLVLLVPNVQVPPPPVVPKEPTAVKPASPPPLV
jgi:hypothetical protein